MTLESSETEFAATYAPYAAQGVLYPGREGSPLLEFVAGGRVLYLFDRSGPYAVRPGPARIVVHGLLDAAATRLVPGETHEERLEVVGISGTSGCGRVLEVGRRIWVVQARLPLVLGSFEPLLAGARPGDWVEFRTLPPLHAFVPA